ncbi:8238_t:CDS:2, partial [Paraglomus occultum]
MMYDELAAFVVEEVALDGDQGTELSRFWNFVDSYVDSKKDELAAPPSTDDQWKDHVWKMLSRMSGMTCKVIPEHRQNTAVQGGTGRKGKGRARDENVELETVDVSNMTLKDVNERFGGRLRLTADADLQRTAMFGDEDIVQLVSAQSLKVLHHVARTRSVGATQADMAKELKLDPRSLFHFVKTLVQKKLVVKLPVVTKGNYTSLVILAKCAPYNSAYAGKSVYLPSPTTGSNPSPGVSFNSHLIRFRITQLLANAKNQMLYASDLLRALGMCNPSMRQRRWFNRTLGGLQRRGY